MAQWAIISVDPKRPTSQCAEQERVAYLEKKIPAKDEVLAELPSKKGMGFGQPLATSKLLDAKIALGWA